MNIVTSPIDGHVLHRWVESGGGAVDQAVTAAGSGVTALRELGTWARCDLLQETALRLRARADTVAADLVTEHGKTAAEAGAEVHEAIAALVMNAETARRLDGAIPEVADRTKLVMVRRIPLGVVGVITPWNFPLNIPIEYIAPALATGNAVIWKPAESTPRTSRHLLEVFGEAGWPGDALQMLEGGPSTGSALSSHPALNAIGFTGSTSVGHAIAAVGGLRALLLELGGNGPTVVFADADLERAAERVVTGASFCSGQSCAATERVLVERAVGNEFTEAVAAAGRRHRVGDPRDPDTTFGPLHLAQTAETMARHIADALQRGSRLISGGAPEGDRPTDRYWPVTVLADVPHDAEVATDETFGPIVPIGTFGDDADLVAALAHATYGLNGALFTGDLARGLRVADEMPCGSVVINDNSNVWETHLPFGGFPGMSSGIGRVGGRYAMDALSTVRTVIADISAT